MCMAALYTYDPEELHCNIDRVVYELFTAPLIGLSTWKRNQKGCSVLE